MGPKSQQGNHIATGQGQAGATLENFQVLFGNLLEGVQILDHNWRYLYLNTTAEKHNRRPNGELLGRKYMDMWPGIEDTHVFSLIERCMEEGVASEQENRFVFPNGEVGWFVLSLQPVPQGVLILSFDITERKQAEEKLRENQARLVGIIDSAMDAIISLDADQRIILFNPAAEQMFGCPASEAIGQPLDQFIPERFRDSHREHIHAFGKSNLSTRSMGTLSPLTCLRANGEEFPAEITISQTRMEGQKIYTAFLRDATERVRAEKALRESEMRFRSLIENSSDEISIVDADGELLYESPTAHPTLGYQSGEFLGQALFQLVHPDDLERIQDQFARLKQDPDLHPRDQFRLRHQDGTWRWVEAVGTNLLSESGVRGIVINYHDITERVQAENTILENERQMRALVTSLDNIVFELDEQATYLNIWTADETLLARPKAQLLGRTFVQVLGEETGRPLTEAVKRVLASGHTESVEYPLEVIGGQRWFLARISPIIGLDHSRRTVSMLVRDITERKQAEAALHESERRFSTAFHASPAAQVISSLESGRILDANEAYCQLIGYEHNELVGRAAAELHIWLNPEDRQKMVERLILGGSVRNLESEFRTRSGGIRTLLTSSEPIDMKGEKCLIATALDITERKRAEEALQESERRFSSAFEYAAIGMALVAPNGRWLRVNQALCNIVGYSEEELLAKTFQNITHPDDLETDLNHVRQMLAGEIQTYQMEKRYLHKSGRIIWVLLSVSLVHDNTGEPAHFISQIQDITERKQVERQVQLQLRRLGALSEIDRAISSSLDMRLSLDVLLSEVLSQLGVDAAAVLLLNESNLTLEYFAGKGFHTLGIRKSRMRLGEGLAGQVGWERKLLHVPNLAEAGPLFSRADLLKDEGLIEYLGVPLIAKGMLKGVLEVFHRTPLNPDIDWTNYLETLGGQAAIAIDNAQMFEGIQQSNMELIAAYDATIAGWSHAMDLRDKETEGHSQRVSELTLLLAEKLGISQQEQVHIRRGALLHDMGKLGVPDHILLKPGKLTEEEWASMRRHPTYALEMLMPIPYLRPALDIPYCHHEKWDGTGYPRGLKGDQIPLAARIFAVVDVWDALTSDRPYRPAWTREQALEYIKEQSGRHFDPNVVDVFLETIGSD